MADVRPTPDEAPFIFMVKLDLVDHNNEDEFNTWYNTHHVRDLMASDGFAHGWRTGEVDHEANFGEKLQEFWAVYSIETITPFEPRPPRDPSAPPPTMNLSGLRLATGLGRVLYDVTSSHESDAERGAYWVRFEFDLDASPEERAEFEADAASTRLPDIARQDGVHRAWQLRAHPHSNQTGPHPPGEYVEIIEADEPSDVLDPARLNPFSDDRTTKWPQMTPRGLHVARKLFELTPAELG